MKRFLLVFLVLFLILTPTSTAQGEKPFLEVLISAVSEAETEIQARSLASRDPVMSREFFGAPYLLNSEVSNLSAFSIEWCRRAGFSQIAPIGAGIGVEYSLYSSVFLASVQKTLEEKRVGQLPLPLNYPNASPYFPDLQTDGNFNPYGFEIGNYVASPASFVEVRELLLRFGEYMRDTWGKNLPEYQLPFNRPLQPLPPNFGQELWALMGTGLVLPGATKTAVPQGTPTATVTGSPPATPTNTKTPLPGVTITPTPPTEKEALIKSWLVVLVPFCLLLIIIFGIGGAISSWSTGFKTDMTLYLLGLLSFWVAFNWFIRLVKIAFNLTFGGGG